MLGYRCLQRCTVLHHCAVSWKFKPTLFAADAIAASGEGVALVKSLQRVSEGIDDKMASAQFRMFKHSAATADGDVSDGSMTDSEVSHRLSRLPRFCINISNV